MYGSCLCAQIRFELVGPRPKLYQCHCSLCRRQGGSASNTATIVEEKQFRWLSGQALISSWVKDSGFRSDFCACCGAPVPNPIRNSSYVWIPAGLLDDDATMEVCAHLFVASKASWDLIASPGAQYETMPELAELFALLHAKHRV